MYMYRYMYMYMYMYMYVCMYGWIDGCMHACIQLYIIYTCINVYSHPPPPARAAQVPVLSGHVGPKVTQCFGWWGIIHVRIPKMDQNGWFILQNPH